MQKNNTTLSLCALALGALALLGAWWPLALLSILLAAGWGSFLLALALGIFFDIAYGAPTGWLQAAHAPFFLLALAGVVLRLALERRLRPGMVDRL